MSSPNNDPVMSATPGQDADEVLPAEWLERCVDPTLPPGVIEIDGHRYPLIEFMEDEQSDGEVSADG